MLPAIASFATLFSDLVIFVGNRISMKRSTEKKKTFEIRFLCGGCVFAFSVCLFPFLLFSRNHRQHITTLLKRPFCSCVNCKQIRCHFNIDVLRHVKDTPQTQNSDNIKFKFRYFFLASIMGLDMCSILRS